MRGDSSILDTLETVEWGVRNFGSLHTNRVCKLRDVRRCETRGYVRCIGPVTVCDGDGFHVEPERYRNGWVLTAKGQTWLDRNRVRGASGMSFLCKCGRGYEPCLVFRTFVSPNGKTLAVCGYCGHGRDCHKRRAVSPIKPPKGR